MVEAALGPAVAGAARARAAAQQQRGSMGEFTTSPPRLQGPRAKAAEEPPDLLQALLDAGSRAGPAEPEGARLPPALVTPHWLFRR
jgi:hypothetical protein